jgi:hypothetical protein
MTSKPGDWMENYTIQSTGDHFFIGYVLLLTTWFFTHLWWVITLVEAVLVLWILVKEYWYDLRFETNETWKSSTVDAGGYIIGNAVAWFMVYLQHRWG